MSKLLSNISIKIGGTVFQNSFKEDIKSDRSDLDNEFCSQPEKYAYWGSLAEIARDEAARLKDHREEVHAVIDAEKRNAAVGAQSKMTEKMVENQVITDPRYKQASKEHRDMELLYRLLTVAQEAMNQKAQMLMQLGKSQRQLETPRIVEQQAQIETIREKAASRRKPINPTPITTIEQHE
jgi:hypothetical protein